MIGLLENLMEEFGGKLDELNLGFTEFLTSYWGPRMHDVLAELHAAELTEEEMRAAESIGVTWHDESPPLEELEEEEEEEEEDDIISRDQMEYWVRELNKIVERNGIPPIS